MDLGTGETESLRLKAVTVCAKDYDDRRWETDIIHRYIQKQCLYTERLR